MLTKSTFTYGRASILGSHVHLEDSWQDSVGCSDACEYCSVYGTAGGGRADLESGEVYPSTHKGGWVCSEHRKQLIRSSLNLNDFARRCSSLQPNSAESFG